MSNRKRINISVDPNTYDRLQQLKEEHGFGNACELIVAFVHILIDRLENANVRQYDLPEEDGEYIDNMFDDLGHTTRTPDGTIPVRHKNKRQE